MADLTAVILIVLGFWYVGNHRAEIADALRGSRVKLSNGLVVSAVLSYGFQIVNYSMSRFGVVDNFTGLVEFLPAALLGLYRSERSGRQLLVTGMLGLWSLRLGSFLLGRMFSRSGPVRTAGHARKLLA